MGSYTYAFFLVLLILKCAKIRVHPQSLIKADTICPKKCVRLARELSKDVQLAGTQNMSLSTQHREAMSKIFLSRTYNFH